MKGMRMMFETNAIIFISEIEVTQDGETTPCVEVFFITGGMKIIPDRDRTILDFISAHRDGYGDHDKTLVLR
jgi:hypothetical protein